MRTRATPALALWVLALACKSETARLEPTRTTASSTASITAAATSVPAAPAPPAPSTLTSAGPSSSVPVDLDLSEPPSFGEAGIATIDPKIPPLERGMMDHSERFGWTSDSREFGYCMVGGGAGETSCGFLPAGGKLEELTDFERGKDEPNRAKTQKLDARIARHTRAAARWPYARDLVLTWKAEIPAEKAGSSQRARLRVGARVRTSGRAALPIDIQAGLNAATIHPEAILVSPDGTKLGLLSHDFGGEFSDHFEVRVFETSELAAQAYNVAGLELHERGAYGEAALLFQRAAFANPKAKLPAYNLACALARLAHPRAKQALELAIARGGPEVRQKAARDHDFDAVRTSDWFREIVP